MIPALNAWAKRHRFNMERVRPFGPSGRSEAWDGTEFLHLTVQIVPQDPAADVVFWLEDLAENVAPMISGDHEESPFAWREGLDVQGTWWILEDASPKAVDPYIADLVEDVEDMEIDDDEPAPSVADDDVEIINRHRATLGMAPIDLTAGWSAAEIQEMARSIRKTGRMQNEGKIRPLLPPTGPVPNVETSYTVRYLVRGVPTAYLAGIPLERAKAERRRLSRRGMTAWVETLKGAFVPVKGAMRKP